MTWTANTVRQTFLDYFLAHNHSPIASSPVIPHSDPTLLFTNSGMAQFKPIFLSTLSPSSTFNGLKMAVNSQKCIRAGGKHNDLEDVGRDTYHHTFFEMLGNWSFGAYFKKEAIFYAWDLLTRVYGLDPSRLYVTYFEGDASQGLKEDVEAKAFWLQLGVEEGRIVKGDAKDNFWEMGDVGPCGPCSEIHYDRIGGRDASGLVNKDDPDVLEIWNLVFMQYNREADRSLRGLPMTHIDTGMGLERLVSILQDKRSNYDTDVFTPLFKRIQEVTGAREYQGLVGVEDTMGIDTTYRIVADHLRTLTFAICDGGIVSNEGRGYVLRRILRRGVRFARKKMGVEIGGFFSSLVDSLVDEMGPVYPELFKGREEVIRVLREEEESFSKTLDRGERLFQSLEVVDKVVLGSSVWRLYDTFGFPIDLTRLMAKEKGWLIDEAQVLEEEKKAKLLSKGLLSTLSLNSISLDVHAISSLSLLTISNQSSISPSVTLLSKEPLTGFEPVTFVPLGTPKEKEKERFEPVTVGKEIEEKEKERIEAVTSKVIQLYTSKESKTSKVSKVSKGEKVGVLLDQTMYYHEQGGQVADTGTITSNIGTIKVEDVQSYGGFVLHVGYVEEGTFEVGQTVQLQIDKERRLDIQSNHTATHLLNLALESTLQSVSQKGSLVDPLKLRFDYTSKAALTLPQLSLVEQAVRSSIQAGLSVYTLEVPLDKALEINNLRAVFGETYPNPVRVVSIGVPVPTLLANPTSSEWLSYSIELCGGTHHFNTRNLDDFAILEDSAVSKGVRRVVAITGLRATQAWSVNVDHLNLDELEKVVVPLSKKVKRRKELDDLKKLFDNTEKKRKAEESKVALKNLKTYFEKSDVEWYVTTIHTTQNPKLTTTLTNQLKVLQKSGIIAIKDLEKVTYTVVGSSERNVQSVVKVLEEKTGLGVWVGKEGAVWVGTGKAVDAEIILIELEKSLNI